MSYSIEIKRQVFRIKQSKCCRFSELYGFMLACGAFAEPGMIKIAVKYEDFFEYYVSLLENICQIDLKAKYVTVKGSRQVTYILQILDPDTALPIAERFGYPDRLESFANELSECCMRAFIRGAFIATGFIADPEGRYCLELTIKDPLATPIFLEAMRKLNVNPKCGKRAGRDVLYLKSADEIGDFLGNIGAKKSAFEYANAEIEKTILNSVNRVMNCETANINKLIDAAQKQRDAILKLKGSGYRGVDESLREAAELRLENMDMSLTQLGKLHSPPLSKAGMAHRMKKLIELAANLPDPPEQR